MESTIWLADYDDEILAQLDYVIGAIHQSFNQSENKLWND